MKVFLNNPGENWVIDRFREEWCRHNKNISTTNILESDIIWLIAPWQWLRTEPHLLESKKVLCTIHHLVPEKFDSRQRSIFNARDNIVDMYHAPSYKTYEQIKDLTKKPIVVAPFWVNQNLWTETNNDIKNKTRASMGINENVFLAGSFQRDTEGYDLKTPKLEKGPDLFCNAVEKLYKQNKNLKVLLAGWRRQYVIERLNRANIDIIYIERPVTKIINNLYDCLDLYIVASRYEGGPQAIFECAAKKVPIVSTDVGAARKILSENSIFEPGSILNATPDIEVAQKNVKELFMPYGFNSFLEMLGDLNEVCEKGVGP